MKRIPKYTPASTYERRPPDGRSRGTLAQAVREHLCREGGTSSREQIEAALQADSRLASKLEKHVGVGRLLYELKIGGFVTLEGETVRATKRTLQRTAV